MVAIKSFRHLLVRTRRAVEASEVELLLEIYPTSKGSYTRPFCILDLQHDTLFRTGGDTIREIIEIAVGPSFSSRKSGLAIVLVGKEHWR